MTAAEPSRVISAEVPGAPAGTGQTGQGPDNGQSGQSGQSGQGADSADSGRRPDGEAAPAPEPSARRWGSAVLTVCAAGWLAFTVAHALLTGRVWWWVLPDMVPPPVYLLLPLLILAAMGAAYALRRPPRSRAGRTALACTLSALVLGVPDSGINFHALTGGDRQSTAHPLHVVSWNTLFWHQDEDPDHFYDYLTSMEADVYLLQEYMVQGEDGPVAVDDTARLRAEFPGYTLVARGELLTLTRLPVVAQRVLTASPMEPLTPWADYWDVRVLRTDLLAGGRTVSFYNVHIADPFDLGQSPLTTGFYTAVHQLSAYREAQWRVLREDLAGNPHPVVVSGALNTLPSMGELRHLAPLRDAARASTSLYPVSFAVRGAWLWRLDATYVSPDVRVSSFGLRGPDGLSTHKAQRMTIGLGE
ncbi:endonuclease/exonuclease/phosphatase family protein [Streptomyces sp. YIM 98790]|uniref:endonuclease/exonuclease/phosphatase family protein n=1 Tax=Streptomyces sp. YIM 98790 TaxID=2689077 RepID=UPI0014097C79|nr:endonuclease/exonuclease/phosphatase family protein [Streptomyces sp. YIM 98790]